MNFKKSTFYLIFIVFFSLLFSTRVDGQCATTLSFTGATLTNSNVANIGTQATPYLFEVCAGDEIIGGTDAALTPDIEHTWNNVNQATYHLDASSVQTTSSSKNPVISFPSAANAYAGSVTVSSNANPVTCTAATIHYRIQVKATPEITLTTVNNSSRWSICDGSDLTAKVTCTSGCGANGSNATSNVVWNLATTNTPSVTFPASTVIIDNSEHTTQVYTANISDAAPKMEVTVGNTVTGCRTTAKETIIINATPVLSAITAPSATMCIYDVLPASVACTLNCGATPSLGNFTWSFVTNGTATAISTNAITSPTLTSANPIYTYAFNLDPEVSNNIEVAPGVYNVQASFSNGICTAKTVSLYPLTVNDKPAVEVLYDNNGALTNNGSTITICEGDPLEFTSRQCNGSTYANVNNNSTASTTPNKFTDNSNTGITYPTPCCSPDGTTNSNGYFFKSYTWTAKGENSNDITVNSNIKIKNKNSSSITITAGVSDDRKATATASMSEHISGNTTNAVTYTLTVEGLNGCTNSDDITITTRAKPKATLPIGAGVPVATGGTGTSADPYLYTLCTGSQFDLDVSACSNCTGLLTNGSATGFLWGEENTNPTGYLVNRNTYTIGPYTGHFMTGSGNGDDGIGLNGTALTSTSGEFPNVNLTINTNQAANDNTYILYTQDDANSLVCSSLEYFKISVIDNPTLTLQQTNPVAGTTICSGVNYTVADAVTSAGATYTWKENTATLSSVTGASYTTSQAITSDNTYKYEVTKTQGTCTSKSNITVAVKAGPIPNVSAISALCASNPSPINVVPIGPTNTYVYTYSHTYTPIATAPTGITPTNPGTNVVKTPALNTTFAANGSWKIPIAPTGETYEGQYVLTVTVGDGSCSSEQQIPFTVQDCGNVVLDFNPSTSNNFCQGDIITVEALYTSTTPSSNIHGVYYQWYKTDIANTNVLYFNYSNPYYMPYTSSNTYTIPTNSNTPSSFDIKTIVYLRHSATFTFWGGYVYTYYYLRRLDPQPFVYPYPNPPVHTASKMATVLNPRLSSNINSDITVCKDSILDFSITCPDCITGSEVYSFYDNNITNAPISIQNNQNNSSPFTHSYQATQTKPYRITLQEGVCKDSLDFMITVKPLPGLNLNTLSNQFCPTNSLAIDATVDSACTSCTYHWNTNQTIPTITVNTPGTFSVTADRDGCLERASVLLSHYPTTIPTFLPINGSVVGNSVYLCGNQSERLAIDPQTCSLCVYQWNTTETTSSILVNQPGGYYANIIDANGCNGVSAPVLFLSSTDGMNAQPIANPSAICGTHNASLEVVPCIGCSYKWYKNTNTTQSLTPNTTGSNRVISVIDSGTYYVEITNRDGCVFNSQTVNVNKNVAAIPLITGSTDSICSGDVAMLTTPYNPNYAYQWYKDGIVISGAVDSSYIAIDTGGYTVKVTYHNSYSCEEESPIFYVASTSFLPTIHTANNQTKLCPGASATLVTDLYPNTTYQWYRDGIAIIGANSATYQTTDAGHYYANITNYNLCTAKTDSIELSVSLLSKPSAIAVTSAICNGEMGTVTVSLCSSCEYQWFDEFGTPLQDSLHLSNYRFDSIINTGNYYALVTNGICFDYSDTVRVTVNTVPHPPLVAVGGNLSVCNGNNVVLSTIRHTGANYQWLLNSIPVIGGANDTFAIINNILDTGSYTVNVTYANGCADTSAPLTIRNGSFTAQLDTIGNVICNGSTVQLFATASYSPLSAAPGGQHYYSLYRDNTPVVNYSNVITDTFYTNLPGVYTVEITNSDGCQQLTNAQQIDEVNIVPLLTARATSNPASVAATAVCGDSGTVYLEVSNCLNCEFRWTDISDTTGIPLRAYSYTNFYSTAVDSMGAAGAGNYVVQGRYRGCEANSNLLQINHLPRLGTRTTFTDTSICNGQVITLAYDPVLNCSTCVFRWLKAPQINATGLPINGATSSLYVTGVEGYYSLEVTSIQGCVDTSTTIRIREVNPPAGLTLQLDSVAVSNASPFAGSPLAAIGQPINLNHWIYPTWARVRTSLGSVRNFTSRAYNGALPNDAGLSMTGNSIFTPQDTLAGFHLITYHYDTLGCPFEVSDVLEVLPPPGVSIVNTNPFSVAYEACVSDTIIIRTTNLNFPIVDVEALNQQGVYQTIPIDSVHISNTSFGGFTVYNSTLFVVVPSYAKESTLKLINGLDTISTPFLLIHNQDLQITGLPDTLCSNGTPIVLSGTPSRGFFTVKDTAGNIVLNAISGDTLDPTTLPASYYAYNNGIQGVDVIYNYVEHYTNNNICPLVDDTIVRVGAKEVFLTSVYFNPVAVSENTVSLESLIYRVFPKRERTNRPTFEISFTGSFSAPAGNPTDFLPKNAGLGKHAMTYTLKNGVCSASIEDSILVIPAPMALALPDTICSNHTPFTFGRDAAYAYLALAPYFVDAGVTTYVDTKNIISVTSTLNNKAIDTISNNINLESYIYDVSQLPDSVRYDTIVIEYKFFRYEDTLNLQTGLGVHVDSLEYTIGKIYKPIFIEAQNDTVHIDRNIVTNVYCEENTLHLLRGLPVTNDYGIGGYFTLQGGTGTYVNQSILTNNVLNPYQIHNIDSSSTTNYQMIYHLNGVVCTNSDTLNVIIPERINTNFSTAQGLDAFCDSDAAAQIIHNITAPNTAIFKIGGVLQSAHEFRPIPLDPGIHVVELVAIDAYACSYSTIDTFTIHDLPNIVFSDTIAGQYCTNDSKIQFTVSPSPYCTDFDTTSSQFVLNETFDTGIPATWTVFNQRAAKQWQPDAIDPHTGAACVFVDTTQYVDTRTTLVTDALNLVAGHNYQITFMVKTGEIERGCTVGTCNAKLRVLMGLQNNLLSLVGVAGNYPQLDNAATYVPVTINYTPTVTGNWFLGLEVYTEDWGRTIRVDDLRMRDITASACNGAGIGYMKGFGVSNMVDSLYEFDPTAIAQGNSEIKYIYTNTNGCTDSLVQAVSMNVYPAVSMTNLDTSYCDNLPAVSIMGTPAGGTFSNQISNNLIHLAIPQFLPATYIPLKGGLDTIRYDYTDPLTSCSATVFDVVFVNEIVDTAILTIDSSGFGFCATADSLFLNVSTNSAAALTGVFSGNGVRFGAAGAGASIFYPNLAITDAGRTGDMTITYVFPTTSGCIDTTRKTVRVHANPNLRWSNLPDSLCLNGDTIQVKIINSVIAGANGNQAYEDSLAIQTGSFTTIPNNYIGLSDYLVPQLATGHNYAYVNYEYVDINFCKGTLTDSVRMDSIPQIRFEGLDRFYCENQDSSLLLAFPSYNVGSGYLQIGATRYDSSFYWIVPSNLANVAPSTNVFPVYYTYKDTRGCIGAGIDTFEIRTYPRINLAAAQDSFCSSPSLVNLMDMIVDSISYGHFTDNLALTSIVQDSLLNLNGIAGPRLVTYHFVDSNTLCANQDTLTISVFNTPQISYQSFGGCVGSNVTFAGKLLNGIVGIDSITNIAWDYGDGTIIAHATLDTTSLGIPNIQHQYNTSNIYTTVMSITNQGLCTVTDTQQLIVSPSHNLANSNNYFEDFQATDGQWYNEQPFSTDTTKVWQYVPVNGSTINDPNNNAWVTAGNNSYGQGLSGWVYTPCFDFTQSKRPMIAMDLWRDMLNNIDGLVLEYYREDSSDWVVVGQDGKGINWYQSNFVLARPGNQQQVTYPLAWTGSSADGRSWTNDWDNVRFRLDQFNGKKDIRFRLAFATSPQTVMGLNLEGAAIDNFWIGERTRNVLVEHFSNEYYVDPIGSMDLIDNSVYSKIFNSENGRDVMLIEYHSSLASLNDKNNLLNDSIPRSRILFYSVPSENQFLLNGAKKGNSKSSEISQFDLDSDMLQDPKFSITIDPIVANNTTVTVSANLVALEDLGWSNYSVRVVIIQDSFAVDNSGHQKLSVMRQMLPDATGVNFSRSFVTGDQLAISENWDWGYWPMNGAIAPDQLEAIVFIQNEATKEIYQAATTQDLTRYIGVDNIENEVGKEIVDVVVYPNPATDYFNVEFSKELTGDYTWRLVDVTGRTLQSGEAKQGTKLFQINTEKLTSGAYFMVINNDRVYTQRKVIIAR